MILAQLRGVKFSIEKDGYMLPDDSTTAYFYVKEVAEHLGYLNTQSYVNDLSLLKRRIFDEE